MTSIPRSILAARASSALAGAYALLGGLITLCGWLFEVERLKDWIGSGVTMKANTAIAMSAAGAAVLIGAFAPARVVARRILALGVALLGGITLVEHVFGLNLGIDTLFFDETPGARATAAPGRMGPPAAASFLGLGVALFLAQSERVRHVPAVLALLVLGISSLSIIGYLYGAEAMYTMPRLTGIALQTATQLLALSVGVLVIASRTKPLITEDSDAGMLARRLLPAALLIPAFAGWLRLEGQRAGLYDTQFGAALHTVVQMLLLSALAWWAVQAIRVRDARREYAERQRRASEERFRSVLDASAVPFAVLAPVRDDTGLIIDFKWTYVNKAAADSFGREAHEVMGRQVSNVLPGSWDEPGLLDRYASVADSNRVERFELRSSANGIDGWFQVVASPLDGEVAVWFADVSERKRQEIELRAADRRKDEFLATLAHELRNPLAPIRQASLLSRKSGLTDAQRQWCNEVIERQVQHMSLLLEDLLDVSRITRGTLQLRRQATSLKAVIESAVETARPLVDSKQHTLTVSLPPSDVLIDVDPLRMAQVISNLLTNAAKYTDARGAIDVAAELEQHDLVVSVADTGIGLAAESMREIFSMFSQVQSAKERSEGGLGIGLALTKGLVELHGGAIQVDSPGLGRGSTFSVRVPNALVEHFVGSIAHSTNAEPRRALRIIVADDNADAAKSLSLLLGSDGHDVHVAHDGEEALQLYGAVQPDVVLLDIGMPKLDGYETARNIRARDSTVLLIATTGWGQVSDKENALRSGFNHHLTKPVDFHVLTKLIANFAKEQDGFRRGAHAPSAT